MIQGYIQVSRKAWAYSAQAYGTPPGQGKHLKRHLRWAALAVLREAAVQGWFSFLEEAVIRPFVTANPRLAFRPMGTYMSRRWGWSRRFKVIRETYFFVNAKGGVFQEAMLRQDGLLLARIPLEKTGAMNLRMRADAQFRKEGEIGVFLEIDGIPGSVSSFACSLERLPTGWTCYVGALQGRKGGDEETIKLATKAMHGLRPKALMAFVAQEVARSLRVASLLGVGNDIHVARARILGPAKKILFDYDDLWLEAGGIRQPDGWYQLPLKAPRRGPEEIKPNKRSMYAKRYAFMDSLSRQIRTVLTAS
ncbi:MAG: DUF535 family protein [Geothrix sp.]|uniref:DUF535 family protein n=1 Tax=Geothrix sp. TaxID=1962974 RepID=UPI0018265EAF|nr:DUF535 family protein [Geothrix sp.]NWJ41545.1 DUF535 family protein [Geothrix sp.]WIL20471.1 MAG: VirK/YbjX family protein [Geothrix sp.]